MEENYNRKIQYFLFLVDISRSMEGLRMESVYTSIMEQLPKIEYAAKVASDFADVKINLMTFSSDAQWMYPSPVGLDEFQLKHVEPFGLTDLGAALKLLHKTLTEDLKRYGWDLLPPKIIIITDGTPTDDYTYYLQKLRKMRLFNYGYCIGIAIGNEANKQVLEEVCTSEGVYNIQDYSIIFPQFCRIHQFQPYYEVD